VEKEHQYDRDQGSLVARVARGEGIAGMVGTRGVWSVRMDVFKKFEDSRSNCAALDQGSLVQGSCTRGCV